MSRAFGKFRNIPSRVTDDVRAGRREPQTAAQTAAMPGVLALSRSYLRCSHAWHSYFQIPKLRFSNYIYNLTITQLSIIILKVGTFIEIFFLKLSMHLSTAKPSKDLKKSADENFIVLLISCSNLGI